MKLTPLEIRQLATLENATKWRDSKNDHTITENIIRKYAYHTKVTEKDMRKNIEFLEDAFDEIYICHEWKTQLYLSWLNDFLSTKRFAEYYNITIEKALSIIDEGRKNRAEITYRASNH